MNTRIDGASCQIIPDDLYTSGEPSLNRLAAAAGDRFDVWQRQINRIILAKSADGFWSARNAVLSIPRQTGKTYDIGWVAIHRAARTPGMRIVWTAQHFSVIKDTFESLCAIVLRPEMSGLVDPDHGISLAAGKEEIRFRNGSRIFFRARERGALRGVKKIALLVIDEAQHLRLPALEELRTLSDPDIVTGVPGNGVCLIGNTEVYSRMMGRQQAQFAQLFSRIKMNRNYTTQKVKKEDIRALFPRLADEKRDKELDFLFGIAKGRWGVRGAKTVYNNSVRNENVSYDGLYSMAVHLGVGWN